MGYRFIAEATPVGSEDNAAKPMGLAENSPVRLLEIIQVGVVGRVSERVK